MCVQNADKPFVRALSRGLAIITSLGETAGGVSLSELAAHVDLDRATARRILMTLETLGYVRLADRRFHLTPKVLALGYAFLSSMPLSSLAGPYLEAAAEEIGGSCSVAVLEGTQLVYVARANGVRRNLARPVEIGTRFPLHSTSAGKVLLAGLSPKDFGSYLNHGELVAFTSRTITTRERLVAEIETVQRQGWASSDQEHEDGIRSVAMPLRDADDHVLGAVNASTQASRLVEDDLHLQLSNQLPILARLRDALEPAIRPAP